VSTEALSLFVACGPGLEPLLAAEIRALPGLSLAAEVLEGGVAVRGDLGVYYRLHLELGLALKLLLRVAEARVRRFDSLVDLAAAQPWERWLTPHTPVLIRASAKRSKLYHTGAIVERIALGMGARLGRPPTLAAADDEGALVVQARFVDDQCTLSIDAAGEPLHRRGYRKATAKAPLREDLARALLLVSGWDRRSPLCDPFAGAGTIALEASWLARAVPPGHLRRFAFMDAPSFEPALFESLKRAALARSATEGAPIFASDRDPGAVAAAEQNRARADAGEVQITRAGMSEAPGFGAARSDGALYVVTNPPYGKRIGEDATVTRLYRALGERLRSLPGRVGLAMTVARPEHAFATGLPLSPALMTDHGGSKIYLSVYTP
jgi:putative N6-adenine-specific DNA methylase